jgi:hypothetical protein
MGNVDRPAMVVSRVQEGIDIAVLLEVNHVAFDVGILGWCNTKEQYVSHWDFKPAM